MNESVPAEQKKQKFKDRAKALARQEKDETAGSENIGVVEFRLANEKHAVESAYVREVLPLKELAAIPCTPPYVLGVINVRGQILSVIDLRVFFELTREAATRATRIIVLRLNEMELGIAADAVAGARSIPLDRVHAGLPTLTGIRETYLRGVAGEDLVILDAAKLLADKSLVVNEEVEE